MTVTCHWKIHYVLFFVGNVSQSVRVPLIVDNKIESLTQERCLLALPEEEDMASKGQKIYACILKTSMKPL